MSVRLKVPVYVSLDATTTPEHPSQGLMLFIYSTAQSEHWFPLKIKYIYILPIALHTQKGTLGFISILFR